LSNRIGDFFKFKLNIKEKRKGELSFCWAVFAIFVDTPFQMAATKKSTIAK